MKSIFFVLITVLLFVYNDGLTQSIQMRIFKNDGTVKIYNIEDISKLTFLGTTGINDLKFNTVAKNFNVLKNYPNPFFNSTTIHYSLPSGGLVEIAIIDLNGKIIKKFQGCVQSPGEHELNWDGKNHIGNKVQPGIYLCNVKFNKQIQTIKIILTN
jgi:hypothetical protein